MAKDKQCPLLKKSCIGHDCVFYVNVQGKHPQTPQIIDRWDCTFAWLPLLLVENSSLQRQTAGEVSAFRSEMRQDNGALAKLFMELGQRGNDEIGSGLKLASLLESPKPTQ